VPLIARQLALFTLGTFHERQGDQAALRQSGLFSTASVALGGMGVIGTSGAARNAAVWGRVYGQTLDQRWGGLLSPQFDGYMTAVQLGADLVQFESAGGHTDRIGAFYAYANAKGDGHGFALGQLAVTGTLNMTSHNLGAYWTHIGPSDWYVDAVLMGTFFKADPRSTRGVSAPMEANSITASVETGVPLRLTPYLTLEPQAQAIWQTTHFDATADQFTTLSFHLQDNLVGRLGLRLQGDVVLAGWRLQPFLLTNLWHAFPGTDGAVFNEAVSFATPFRATALEFGGGVVASVTDRVGIYANGSYTRNAGGQFRETIKGQMGFRVIW
jgi:outer membrane autotransporter protein